MEGSITISVPNNITIEELKEIRQQFKKEKLSKEYKLNIFISGTENITTNLSAFLIAKLK